MSLLNAKRSLLAGALATIGASLCCLGPLLLLSLGIGGAWISRLTALEPLRPFFMVAALLFLALAFRRLYLAPGNCAPGSACPGASTTKHGRWTFWAVTLIALGLLASPWFAPFFY